MLYNFADPASKVKGPFSKSLIIKAVCGVNTCVTLGSLDRITFPVASSTFVYNIGSVYNPLLPKAPKAEAKIKVLPPSGSAGSDVNSPSAATDSVLEASEYISPSFSP